MKSIVVMLFAAALTGSLVACQGGRGAPAVPASLPLARAAQPARASDAPHAGIPSCELSRAPLPGTYIVLESNGNLTDGAYTASDGSWTEGRVTAGPTPPPGSGPRTPTQPTDLYIGTYRFIRSGQSGCAYLETTLDGKPFPYSTTNASIGGFPDFGTANFTFQSTESGAMRIGRLKVSGTEGRASLVLMLRGHTFDVGTLVLHRRIVRRGP